MRNEELRVYHSLEEIQPGVVGPTALTIGNFDGVHAGHRRIFRRVAQVAQENGWNPSVLTFDPHPTRVVAPDRAPRLLSSIEQRCEWMLAAGIRQVFVLPFDSEFARLTPEEFVRQVLQEKLEARAVLVGDNFRFGNRAAGDVRTLTEFGKQYGFTTEVVHAVTLRRRMISSSAIRTLIDSGQVSLAARFLGRPYGVDGEVVHGHGIGSRETVPTLNLKTPAEVIPRGGVYVTHTHDLDDGRRWQSVTNIGYRPTFDGHDLSIETFLLEPLEAPSPRHIRVEFLHRLREEKKFENSAVLKAQILRDAARARKYFRLLGERATAGL
jgi:riboflavin kinase / FMN adenylyltransferase